MLSRLTSTNTLEICTGMRVERRENMVNVLIDIFPIRSTSFSGTFVPLFSSRGIILNSNNHILYLRCLQLSPPEPDWVASEREQFTQFRDTDGNGLMDLEEVKVWMEYSLKWSWIMRRIVWLHEILPNSLHRPGSFHQTLTTAKQRPR